MAPVQVPCTKIRNLAQILDGTWPSDQLVRMLNALKPKGSGALLVMLYKDIRTQCARMWEVIPHAHYIIFSIGTLVWKVSQILSIAAAFANWQHLL